MSSLEERTQYFAALMAGGTPEPLPPEQPAAVERQSAAAVRPAGELTSPGFDALPEDVRGPLVAAIGKALAEQQLQFAAQGVMNAPGDVTRYLRPEDYARPDGSVDVPAVTRAVAQLAADRPHLAWRPEDNPRRAAQDGGQGAGQGVDGGMQARVDAVKRQMADPLSAAGSAAVVEHYRR